MAIKKHASKLDNIGMTASVLCAVHCALVPILLTCLPLLGLSFLANPWLEWSMIVFALCIGILAISFSFFNTHRRMLPLILLVAGFAVIIAGHLFVTGWREAVIVPLGGMLIATAHFFNLKYTGICRRQTNFHFRHRRALNEFAK